MPVLSSTAVRTGLTYVLSFGLGKATAFCAALAIPRLVDAHVYGVVELSLTLGILGASVFGLGAHSVATRSHLLDRDPRARTIIVGQCLWLAAIGLVLAGCLAALGFGAQYVCGAAMIGLFGLQFSAAAYTRMRGHIHLSGWFDNISMLLVFLVVALFVLTGGKDLLDFEWMLLMAALAIGVGAGALFLRMPLSDLRALAWRVMDIGTPMMFFGAATLLIFGTSRIAIAKGLTLADVACFSACARIALVLVFASQIVTTGLFRRVYQLGNAAIDQVFTVWIVILSGLALLLAVAGYFGAELLVLATNIPAAGFAAIFPAVVVQTTLWVLNSNVEMFILRELIARQAAIACVAIALLGLATGLALAGLGALGLMTIINLYSLAMAVLLLVQMALLARKGVSFRGAYFALPLVAAPWLVLLLPAPA